ncbi:4Fe-4S binding protein [Candidatus Thorarchaeota archaeon]|nr:MAG: 4Fe-4S binding protein [Candidatus Thorarchaeota archaeon]
MADDAEDQDMPDIEDESPAQVEDEADSRFSIRNPVGLIFNVRNLRRVVQILFLLGINGYLFAAWFGQDAITEFWTTIGQALPTIPIIAPLEAPFAVMAGSFDAMQRVMTSGIFPFFTLGAMVIILTVLGRAACGWVCPIGTIHDFSALASRSKVRPSPGTEKELRRFKAYVFALVMFFASWVGISVVLGSAQSIRNALGIFADAAFDPINPAYILFVKIPELVESGFWPTSIDTLWRIGYWTPLFWLQITFVALIVIGSKWFPRWFCRWVCPAGWFYSVFSRSALIGIGRNPALCTPDVCNTCEVVCPMNIRIRRFPYQHLYSPDCIMCLECKSHCPNGAIEIRFS